MIRDNVSRIKERISFVCSKVGRFPDEITLVAVTKGEAAEQIEEAIKAGIVDIGENKVQEALLKYNDTRYALGHTPARWHMVGHLQSNKVKKALEVFDLIQSVDSLSLALAINKEASRINKVQDILIEIKTSPESAKFGLKPAEAIGVIKEISGLKNVNIKGLMTIAPLVDNPQQARPYFKMLRELRDEINESEAPERRLHILSMGMSDDFQAAIEEGSNMIRLGRAIFEIR